MTTEPTRCLIASGDRDQRAALRDRLLVVPSEIEVVALASTADEALFLTGTASPDVVVTETTLPDAKGIDLSRTVRHQFPMVSVVLLAASMDDDELFEAIRYGAAAYLDRSTDPAVLADTVRRVHRGTYVIDEHVLDNPALALRVLSAFRELTRVEEGVKPLFVPLSPRELEVLEHAAHGSTNRSIAREMSISEQTVKNHLGSIMRKLAVNDRTQAVVYAMQQGWINVRSMS